MVSDVLEDLGRALERALHGGRHVELVGALVDLLDRFAERRAGRQVEGQRHGRKLP